MGDIADSELDQIAPAKLAINRKVKQREVAQDIVDLEPNADRPDLLCL